MWRHCCAHVVRKDRAAVIPALTQNLTLAAVSAAPDSDVIVMSQLRRN